MDRQEAKLVLQALRPDDFKLDEPAFADALALAETDPELKKWWDAQQEFDRKVAAKLTEIPIPEDLRATIMAGRKIEKFTPPPSYSLWLAAAAVIGILCVAGSVLHDQLYGRQGKAEYAEAVLPLLGQDAPDLAMVSPDRDKIMAWLKDRKAPMGTVPGKMTSLSMVGCQKYKVHGHMVTLICFAMENGKIAHLFIVNRDALVDPPALNVPEVNNVHGWSTAAWSDGHMSYLLATQAGEDALRKLL